MKYGMMTMAMAPMLQASLLPVIILLGYWEWPLVQNFMQSRSWINMEAAVFPM